ncbi:MAG: DUF4340 domain-containing protein [Planctomycetota bacterium]|nr:MAG: DUF4340 domain-containing protein [Planctomycetota bacterium]
MVLMVRRHDGKAYAKRADRGTIYAAPPSLVTQLTQEFRKDRVMPFEAADVTRFSIRHGQTTHVFARRDDKWIYEPEPDLPLDKAKVENLLLQVRDLRTPRFVEHTLEDLAPFGLDDPAVEVMVSFKDGSARTLRVAAEPVTRMGIGGYYASADGVDGVFLLTQPALDRIEVDLAALEAQAR